MHIQRWLQPSGIQTDTEAWSKVEPIGRGSFVICCRRLQDVIVVISVMPRSPIRTAKRAPRVKLAGTILALLRLENGRQVRARVHMLSITGGLLHLEVPLDEGIKVEIMFHVGDTTVRTKGRTLFPMWATSGYMQPFEFCDLEDEARTKLEADIKKLLGPSPAPNASTTAEPLPASGTPLL